MTDEEIVELVKKGDTQAFGEIVEKYQGPVFGYIRKMINQIPEEAEDLAQEVLIAAYENINGFEKGRKFSSWIYRIAHNKAIDYFKKRKVKTSQIEDMEEILMENKELIEDLEIKNDEIKKLREAVEKLEINYREVIVLNYFEEKSYEEISDILKIPVSNVGVMLHRGRERLRKLIISNE
jgi:RNA polymerase sigma-70 factor (ECF subfamily)